MCPPSEGQAGLLSALGSLGLMIWLMATPHSHETEQKRLGLLAGFAFLTGMFGMALIFEGATLYFSISLDQGPRYVCILMHPSWHTVLSCLVFECALYYFLISYKCILLPHPEGKLFVTRDYDFYSCIQK